MRRLPDEAAEVRASPRYVPRVKLYDQVGSWITLDAPDLPPRTFEIVLRRLGADAGFVDYWDRAVGFN